MFFDGGDVERVGGEDGGDQQRLGGDLAVVERGLQLFVEDAFVRRVHVDDDQAVRVLGQDVDAVQLGQRVAERRASPVDGFGGVNWGALAAAPVRRCLGWRGRRRGRRQRRVRRRASDAWCAQPAAR